eukprot:s2851_g14.t1
MAAAVPLQMLNQAQAQAAALQGCMGEMPFVQAEGHLAEDLDEENGREPAELRMLKVLPLAETNTGVWRH